MLNCKCKERFSESVKIAMYILFITTPGPGPLPPDTTDVRRATAIEMNNDTLFLHCEFLLGSNALGCQVRAQNNSSNEMCIA